MSDPVEKLEKRVGELESQIRWLALRNLDLVHALGQLVNHTPLDKPINYYDRGAERPSVVLDQIWDEIYEHFSEADPE